MPPAACSPDRSRELAVALATAGGALACLVCVAVSAASVPEER
jgi:hypothetical protein